MHLIYFVNSVASAKYIDSRHNDIFFTVDQETIGKSSRQPSFCRIGSPAPTLFSELRPLIKNNLLGRGQNWVRIALLPGLRKKCFGSSVHQTGTSEDTFL